MAQYPSVTALPTRLAALAALGLLLITACGNEPDEASTVAPDSSSPSVPDDASPDDTGDQSRSSNQGAAVSLVIERTLGYDQSLPPETGYEEGTWTLTCSPVGGDHPDPEAACAEIEEVGAEPFLLDTTDMTCTMQMGGPEVVYVTGRIDGTEIDTEFNKVGGCEIDRFETVSTVITP
ncbi:proteinase inhibitor I4 serpin [Nocardiopsis sp. CNR-923]|uniref:SSI family serine proteinase inhibitor n=1 Tax=Nocardiopsis sp. CNR-923 TaxID=1904965 RepID=UPI000965D99D|nr:SSI family serine proteinase inhibitor [Nocardiopsis sp. CNR-923]OLT29516.1 proteinase inhibitor I4 serpin [Nocardiopsis sp. CNR-923]